MEPPRTHAGALPNIDYAVPGGAVNVSAIAFGIVSLKLIGLFYLFEVVTMLPVLMSLQLLHDYPASPIGVYASAAVKVGLAITLLVLAKPLAQRLFREVAPAPLDLGGAVWMTIIIAGVGLSFLLFSLEDGVRGAVTMVTRVQANRTAARSPIEAQEMLYLLLPFVKLGLGALLFLRPAVFLGRWTKRATL